MVDFARARFYFGDARALYGSMCDLPEVFMSKEKVFQEDVPGMPEHDYARRYLQLEELRARVESAQLELKSARAALKAAIAAIRR